MFSLYVVCKILAGKVVMDTPKEKYYDIIIRDLEKADVKGIVREAKLDPSKEYIRLWKLGSLEHKVYPTEQSFRKLKETLEKWDGISTIDIIWDDGLKVEVIEID